MAIRTVILGLSAYFHDSAAALVIDGNIVAAAQEERFSRVKHDASFPTESIKYVLSEAGLQIEDISMVVFYEKPFLKFERLLETYHAFAPRGIRSFLKAIPVWIKEKIFLKRTIAEALSDIGPLNAKILFGEHHLSHAGSAFFPSPFRKAAILTIDGVGEWASASIGIGEDNTIKLLKELHFPHSVGLLYSSFTYYCGFQVNNGEYKLMGLAPYANDTSAVDRLVKIIREHLVDVREDGSIVLNMAYFNFATGLRMTDDKKWTSLFGFPPRPPESEITAEYIAMAKAAQMVVEDIVLKLAETARKLTQCNRLVMAGGVALNCVINGKLYRQGLFEDIWIQPAAGDAGGAIGAALTANYVYAGATRHPSENDSMKGSYLGPGFTDREIKNTLGKYKVVYNQYSDENLFDKTAGAITEGNVVGWFQGRMEFGPRALGNRSILADPRDAEMQKKLNLKIKFRESFRPFAPSVLEEEAEKIFDMSWSSPYMLTTCKVASRLRHEVPFAPTIKERVSQNRSKIPAVTHMDSSARVQTVSRRTNPRFHTLISRFYGLSGVPLLVNTSFNVRGEPIVCSPEDALRCFFHTEMDILVLGNFICEKNRQPEDIKDRLGAAATISD